MKRRPTVVLIAILAGTLLLPILPAQAQQTTLVVTGYGGRWSEVMKKALVEPFEKKHNVKVEVVTGITTEWVAKLLAAGPDNPPYDVVFGNEPAFPIPRERGFFEKRNETLAPNIKNLYPKALIGDTSLAMFWGRIGLAYRTDIGPQEADVLEGLLGRGLRGQAGHLRHRQHARHQLPLHRLEDLRQGLLRHRRRGRRHQARPAQAGGLHRHRGEAARAEGGRDRGAPRRLHLRLQKRGIPVDWVAPSEGQPILDQIVQVTKGSKNKELAWKFIDAYLSPEVQLAFATELFWSPTNKTVKVPADVAKKIISGPADVDKLVLFDWAQVAKQRPQWTEKWNKEMR